MDTKRLAPRIALFIFTAAFVFSLSAKADVTVLHDWRMGENDPGVYPGAAAVTLVDSVGSDDLVCSNQPLYSADSAPAPSISSISTSFTNGAYAVGPLVPNLTDNFGIECWVKVNNFERNQIIVYDGNTSSSGFGIYADGFGFSGLFGGNSTIFSPIGAETNVWTEVALVCTNGIVTLFTNGVLAATAVNSPAPATGNFGIGADPQTPGRENLDGVVDEVRIFSIPGGLGFTTNDLLLPQFSTVTSTSDSGAGSLRAVVGSAPAGTTITFDPSLSGQSIGITSGLIAVTNNIRIDASALANGIQINGNGQSSVFEIYPGVSAVMNSLTITNAWQLSGSGGAIVNNGTLALNQCILTGNAANNADGGGAIFNDSILTANQCLFSNNISTNSTGGGAIYNDGSAIFNQCVLSGNSNTFDGGAIFNGNESTLTLNQCTLSGNSASPESDGGGGVYSAGSLTVLASTFFSNSTAGDGGGILSDSAAVTIENSTFVSNSTVIGGGGGIAVEDAGASFLVNCTIVSNSAAASGGGIFNLNTTLDLTNCIVAGNTASTFNDIKGTVTASFCFTNGNPMLAPLGDYGGPTPTLPPVSGSPVLDVGTDSVTNILAFDQRGFPRLAGASVDIGAVEGAALAPVAATQVPSGVTTNAATLNGTINPGDALTSYYFEYGTTTNYTNFGTTNILNAGVIDGEAVNLLLTNLLARDYYHYQLVASNVLGVIYGGDVYFHTGGFTNMVTTTNDSGEGSLRDAITNSEGGDLVTFTQNLSGATLLLTNGTIDVSASITIDASALSGGIIIDGDSNCCVFDIITNTVVTMDGLTVTNGYNSAGLAAGIYSEGNLTLNQCTITGNYSPMCNSGAGINNEGTLVLNQCTVTGNLVNEASGGGIYNQGILELNQCLISDNAATNNSNSSGDGGGLCNNGVADINQCTFSGNFTVNGDGGGAIVNNGVLTITSSTIVSNTVHGGWGGGILDGSIMSMADSTLAGNSAVAGGTGGGIYNIGEDESICNCTITSNSSDTNGGGGILDDGTLSLTNCIVAGNTPDDALDGVNCLTNGNPLLAALGNYGGPTLTMPPLPGSPAIDAGTDSVTNVLPIDQRGDARLSGAHVDIGAVEIQAPTVVILTPASGVTVTNLNLAVTGAAGDSNGVAMVFVKDTGDSGFTQATTSNNWTNWSATVTLAPGQNTISAYSVNSNGYVSLTNSVTVNLPLFITGTSKKPYGQLLLHINPPGPASSPNKVSPNDSDKLILLGTHVSLTAVPGRNQIFSNWLSGTNKPYTVTTTPTLKFVMESNMVVEANFVTNIFLSAEGSYVGLFAPTNSPRQQTNSGFISFSVTSAGALSGKINLAGAITPISGKFDLNGLLTNVARRVHMSNLTTVLQLNFTNQTVMGSVSDGSFTSPLLAVLNGFSAKVKATNFAGQYTMAIPGTTNAAEGPYGTSVATVKISPTGAVTLSGSLADGTPVTASSAIYQNGLWPLYVSLYKGRGSFWSWNYFSPGGLVSSNDFPVSPAAPSWINETNSVKTALYRSGFTNNNLTINGSAYSPTNSPVLTNLAGRLVLLNGGDFPDLLLDHLDVSGAINTTNIVLTLTKATGAITGYFMDPLTEKKTKATGVLLQGQTNIGGYFLGSNESGLFELAPAQ